MEKDQFMYEPPIVNLFLVEVEKGFAASNEGVVEDPNDDEW